MSTLGKIGVCKFRRLAVTFSKRQSTHPSPRRIKLYIYSVSRSETHARAAPSPDMMYRGRQQAACLWLLGGGGGGSPWGGGGGGTGGLVGLACCMHVVTIYMYSVRHRGWGWIDGERLEKHPIFTCYLFKKPKHSVLWQLREHPKSSVTNQRVFPCLKGVGLRMYRVPTQVLNVLKRS